MEYKKEEISIPASDAERFDQRTFPGAEMFLCSRPILTPQEREIAIEALGRKLSGSGAPAAAADLLAGIAVLDGAHRPVLIWPTDMSLEEKAAWHEREASDLKERVLRFQERMKASTPSVEKKPQAQTGLIQMSGELAPILPALASSAPVPLEAGTDSRSPQAHERTPGSSDAC